MDFVEALKSQDIKKIEKIPKSDIHNHAGRSGNRIYLQTRTEKSLPLPPEKFESLDHMQSWYSSHIKPAFIGVPGFVLRWEAGFAEAKRSNIIVLTLSFSRSEIEQVGGVLKFKEILEEFHKQYCPDTVFLPELSYGSDCDNIEYETDQLEQLAQIDYFKSIDICGAEFAQPIENFVPLYRKAKSLKFRLKAHVGEFGTADSVMKAVEVLELNEVHHGIAAVNSNLVMHFLAKNQIQLNICPSSNVMLGVASSYATHPIQKLFREGIPVTINTDDLLIFNQPVSKEYLNLYQAGTLTAIELDEIRRNGLNERSR